MPKRSVYRCIFNILYFCIKCPCSRACIFESERTLCLDTRPPMTEKHSHTLHKWRHFIGCCMQDTKSELIRALVRPTSNQCSTWLKDNFSLDILIWGIIILNLHSTQAKCILREVLVHRQVNRL